MIDTKKPLRILGLYAENFQGLKFVKLHTDGTTVILKGPNGAGKTSILDSIPATLAGTRAIATEPIRRGTSQARTRIEIGPPGGPVEMIAHRSYVEGETKLRLEVVGTGNMSDPQTALERILGIKNKKGAVALSFDPEAFRMMKARERAEYLLGVVGLDFRELDAQRGRTFERRTEVGRAQKRANTLALNARPEDKSSSYNPVDPEDLGTFEASVEDARKAIEAGLLLHAAVFTVRLVHTSKTAAAARSQESLRVARNEVERLVIQVSQFEDQLRQDADAQNEAMNAQASAELDAEEANLEELRGFHQQTLEILEVKKGENLERGRVYDLEQKLIRLTAESAEQNQRWAALTQEIEAIDLEKRTALSDAEFPVAGLSVNEDCEVLLDDLPFDQASGSDQLRVSVAIPMALNPLFPLAIIRRASELGPEQIERIHKQVTESGGQVWLEMVYTDKDQGSVVEVMDGKATS